MRILGIVSETHDTGIAIIEDGKPVLVIEEERLDRIKHTMAFPHQSVSAARTLGLLAPGSIDAVTVPWRVARLRQSFLKALLHGFPASLNLLRSGAHTKQNKGIVLLHHRLRQGLGQHGFAPGVPIVGVGHHNAHAAMFFCSPFDEASVLVMDGYGDDAATTVYAGSGNRLDRQWASTFFNSLGMVYSFVTRHLGFEAFEEGTVMALAAHGDGRYVEAFRDTIHLEPDGRYRVNMDYFLFDRYAMRRPFSPRFIAAFGPARGRDEPVTDHHMALARALQETIERAVIHLARGLAASQRTRNLVVTGGVALNCVANARILEETDFERIWVPPCASDTGAPLGSALWHYHHSKGAPRNFVLEHPFYGLEESEQTMRAALEATGLTFERLDDQELFQRVARDLADGRIVGWFQGRFEMGPRALGNRSILADARRPDTRAKINARIKYRESFRPFAPVVLAEHAHEYFEIDQDDPFMTMAPRVRPEKRDVIPAGVHVDGTGRIQTVARSANPRYYDLIAAFHRLTGVPVLINTSFNRQEPIVARAREAVSCYLRTDMDVLVLGNLYSADRNADAVARARAAFTLRHENLAGGE